MRTLLCIGGPLDKRLVAIERDQSWLNIPVMKAEYANPADPMEGEIITTDTIGYYVFSPGYFGIEVLAPAEWSEIKIFQYLLGHYATLPYEKLQELQTEPAAPSIEPAPQESEPIMHAPTAGDSDDDVPF